MNDLEMAVRNEMAWLALFVHRLTHEAGCDAADAIKALADIEDAVVGARREILNFAAKGAPR